MPKKHNKQDYGKFMARLINSGDGVDFKPPRKDGAIATKPFLDVPDVKEAEVLRACMSWLRIMRVGAKRMNSGAGYIGDRYGVYGIPGAGDILCVYGGQYIEVECKRGRGGHLSERQQKHKEWVEFHGGFYFVVHGTAELEYYFQKEIFNEDAK